jgi:hypothetical protein
MGFKCSLDTSVAIIADYQEGLFIVEDLVREVVNVDPRESKRAIGISLSPCARV